MRVLGQCRKKYSATAATAATFQAIDTLEVSTKFSSLEASDFNANDWDLVEQKIHPVPSTLANSEVPRDLANPLVVLDGCDSESTT